mmetsp:Transcript_9219/g.16102  ORF Transcript_9219/g.16102 Transcript_9219/m.16102 type:complete len:213 (-) Transcript_9219:165-803(-)
MPSTTSSSSTSSFPSPTVIVPSLPTRSIASAISSPMARSPLAEMVATDVISSLLEILLVISLSSFNTWSTALSIPRLRSIGFMPAATALIPSEYIARVSTVAVVVPSPAISFVALATLRTSCAPRFICLSLNSTFLATVTPSLVICGDPYDFSMMTFRPFGPSVTCTASASASTPRSIRLRASILNRRSLPVAYDLAELPGLLSAESAGACL